MNKKLKFIMFLFLIFLILLLISFLTTKDSNKDNGSDKYVIDTDDDGIPNNEDDFPYDPAASLDSDDDGYPNEWNQGKEKKDSTNNLTLDSFPYDPSAHLDSDNDGYPDSWNKGKNQSDSTSIPPLKLDEYPNDPNAHQDTDNDGYADYYDINDNVNLSLSLKIKKITLNDRVDILPWGQLYFVIEIDGKTFQFKNNGFGWWSWLNKKKYVNVELNYDIPDNTDNDITKISISMYDYDIFTEDYQLDIGQESNKKSIILRFNNLENNIDFDNTYYGDQATIWLDIDYSGQEKKEEEYYDKTFNWRFNSVNYDLNQKITKSIYDTYLNYDISRIPFFSDVTDFVTPNEPVIEDISKKINHISEIEKFSSINKANFILKFVQYNVEYSTDNLTKGCEEYWKFPVETLVEQKGDCEDTSVLYASILDNLGYDTVLLYYKWEEQDKNYGHLAVGVNIDGDHGEYIFDNGKKYYYCETTNKAMNIGYIPDGPSYLKEDPYKIIHI